ncbi:S-layer homology domain-containing protein [Bacillus testis]|uniref:S-layer homology domain-containing protein n=1 Tax=Bacillus testis TaxID=1622072 RepID=UPI00067E8FF9|nr:S-layer homology domain-containing protein [Bacillus testis]
MAYQPKSYRKFVATAATATLVASAVAPLASAASFTDVKESYKEAVDFVVSKGALGLTPTQFGVDKEIKRVDAAVLLAQVLGLDTANAPASGFTDVPARAEKYVGALKAAGFVNGKSAHSFGAQDNIKRGELALMIAKGFGLSGKADLKFTDVSDRYTEAVQALVANNITNGTTPTQFGTDKTAKRGDYAKFLFAASKVKGGEVDATVTGIKAINATTVEVTYKEVVADVNAAKYTIDGLTVSNAAVKQSDSKTVVLTTTAQEGGKKYTVKSGDKALGQFEGISAVVPTAIEVSNSSVQGVVGKEVTLKADVKVKQAGIPVTFNVKSGDKLNKDYVVEALTDANGVATYSYTQYVAGNDDVAVYPTGAPATRAIAKVYWGVSESLTITADDKKGNEVNNGENKTYKIAVKDPKTGYALANKKVNVTFAENINTTIDKVSSATINGENPYQLSNGSTKTVTVTTNSNGEAIITVAGTNTKVTPVAFIDDETLTVPGNGRVEPTELQAKGEQLTIGAIQSSYDIQVTREGAEEAATGITNGREYKVVLKTKDGKVAANEIVNVAFNEDLDRVISTNTSAYFVQDDKKVNGQISIKTDSKGEATFTVASENSKDYATPVVWIDINSSNAKNGKLDDGEPSKVAPITYFAEPKLTNGVLKAYNGSTEIKEDKFFTGIQTATFKYTAANQSGNEFSLPTGYASINATFTVFNTGANDITVDGEVVSPNRSTTVYKNGSATPSIDVKSVDNKTTSVRVEASGTAIPASNTNNKSISLGSYTAKASFVSTTAIGTIHTGVVENIDRNKEEIKFVGKDKMSYKGAITFKNVNSVVINQTTFENLVEANKGTVVVTVTKDANDKYSFEIVSLDGNLKDTLTAVNNAQTPAQVVTALESSTLSPAFGTLKTATQKTAVGTAVLTARASAGGEFTETGFKNAYLTAYNTEVTSAVSAVANASTAATVKSNIINVPGLDLKGVNSANETAVYTALVSFTGETLEALQTAVTNAINGVDSAAKLKAVNDATTNEEVLTALIALPDVDLTNFNKAPERVKALVLKDVIDNKPASTGYTNSAAIKQEIREALENHKDDTSVAINSITFTAATSGDPATPATLEFKLSDNVDLPATIASADVGDLGITFEDGNTLGAGASATYDPTTTTLKVTLGSDSTVKAGNVLKTIKINDQFGVALDLSATKADGKTLVTSATKLIVTTPQ